MAQSGHSADPALALRLMRRTPQDFWPDAIASSRVFALGEVWHNALVSEVKRYADAIRRGPGLASRPCCWRSAQQPHVAFPLLVTDRLP